MEPDVEFDASSPTKSRVALRLRLLLLSLNERKRLIVCTIYVCAMRLLTLYSKFYSCEIVAYVVNKIVETCAENKNILA